MSYQAVVHGERFTFADLRELLAKANERKSGDELAGIAAATERERVAAKMALADTRVADFRDHPLIDDEVTAATRDAIAPAAEAAIASLTIGQLRELILAPQFPALWRTTLAGAFLPEVAAAVAKIMSDLDLVSRREAAADRHPLPQHDGRGGHARRANPAEPPDRRPGGHPRLGRGRPRLRLRGRGHRRQPGDRLGGEDRPAARGRSTSSPPPWRSPPRPVCLAHATTQVSALEAGARSTCCSSHWRGRRKPTARSA